MKHLKSKVTGGFSLVEILVVIAVIGVIAAITIPNVQTVSHKNHVTQKAGEVASAWNSICTRGEFEFMAKSGTMADKIGLVTTGPNKLVNLDGITVEELVAHLRNDPYAKNGTIYCHYD